MEISMFDGWDLVAEPPPVERDFQSIIVGGRAFAIAADAVRGQLGPMRPTPVPGAVRFVRGVLMWEGQVVPVLATDARLSLPRRPGAGGPLPLLQLEVAGESFFLEVEEIAEVIAGGRLEPADGEVPMVLGFIEKDERRIPVLDLDALTGFGRARSEGVT